MFWVSSGWLLGRADMGGVQSGMAWLIGLFVCVVLVLVSVYHIQHILLSLFSFFLVCKCCE